MNRTKTLYWIFTVLFSAAMIFTAVPDVLLSADAVTFMKDHLGFPNYFTFFIGVAKILGSIVILIPGLKTLKEWAYAGLVFDLVGAIYSVISVDGFQPQMLIMLIWVVLFVLSYIYYRKTTANE
ncbi:MAG: DoxX family protein [Flavipsychrobacter sp.]|nr:DoxX family protein [Flavipsychrobacter sp.]